MKIKRPVFLRVKANIAKLSTEHYSLAKYFNYNGEYGKIFFRFISVFRDK